MREAGRWDRDLAMSCIPRQHAHFDYCLKRCVGFKGGIVYDRSRPDGTPRKLLDSSRIQGMGWKAATTLEEGVEALLRLVLIETGQAAGNGHRASNIRLRHLMAGALNRATNEIVSPENVPIVRDRSVRDSALCFNLRALHLPDIDLPTAVLTPENVAVAVAVEVANALDMPVVRDRSVHHAPFPRDLQAVHLPDIDLPTAVLTPENVAVAVAVEVADALDVPVVGDRSVRDSALRFDP